MSKNTSQFLIGGIVGVAILFFVLSVGIGGHVDLSKESSFFKVLTYPVQIVCNEDCSLVDSGNAVLAFGSMFVTYGLIAALIIPDK